MAKKDKFNNNDPISKAVDLLLKNTEDLTTVFKEGGLYKDLKSKIKEEEFYNDDLNHSLLNLITENNKKNTIISFQKNEYCLFKIET